MKQNRRLSSFMFSRMKKVLKQKYGKHATVLIKKARVINKELLKKINKISATNPLAKKIQCSMPVISLWLASDKNIKPENIGEIMYKAINCSRGHGLQKIVDLNTEKGLKKYTAAHKRYSKWIESHPKDENSWKINFDDSLHDEGFYYNFSYCPIASFCKENGMEEIAPVICKIEYLFVQLNHGVLLQKNTIANGGNICDFWVVGDKKPMFVKW